MKFSLTLLSAATLLAVSMPTVTYAEEDETSYDERLELATLIKTMRKVRKQRCQNGSLLLRRISMRRNLLLNSWK